LCIAPSHVGGIPHANLGEEDPYKKLFQQNGTPQHFLYSSTESLALKVSMEMDWLMALSTDHLMSLTLHYVISSSGGT
jgi:hypothetical protein